MIIILHSSVTNQKLDALTTVTRRTTTLLPYDSPLNVNVRLKSNRRCMIFLNISPDIVTLFKREYVFIKGFSQTRSSTMECAVLIVNSRADKLGHFYYSWINLLFERILKINGARHLQWIVIGKIQFCWINQVYLFQMQ